MYVDLDPSCKVNRHRLAVPHVFRKSNNVELESSLCPRNPSWVCSAHSLLQVQTNYCNFVAWCTSKHYLFEQIWLFLFVVNQSLICCLACSVLPFCPLQIVCLFISILINIGSMVRLIKYYIEINTCLSHPLSLHVLLSACSWIYLFCFAAGKEKKVRSVVSMGSWWRKECAREFYASWCYITNIIYWAIYAVCALVHVYTKCFHLEPDPNDLVVPLRKKCRPIMYLGTGRLESLQGTLKPHN